MLEGSLVPGGISSSFRLVAALFGPERMVRGVQERGHARNVCGEEGGRRPARPDKLYLGAKVRFV